MRLPETTDVLIVGAGIFGSVIGSWLARSGHDVTIVDAEKPRWGSGPAACLMKPSWLTSFTRKQRDQSFHVLDQLYGVRDLIARVGPVKATVHWVPPAEILKKGRYIRARVNNFGNDGGPFCRFTDGSVVKARTIIFAAGVWCKELLRTPVTPQAGVAFTWAVEGGMHGPTIRPWAPYKQLVSMSLSPWTLWAGDGTAMKPESLTEVRIQQSLERCAAFVDLPASTAQCHYGLRPYVKGMKAPAFLEKVLPNIWVATGGAKNGTAGAGWAAHELELRLR